MGSTCKNPECSVSTGICGTITHGWGELDFNGYWEFPCDDHPIEHEDDFDPRCNRCGEPTEGHDYAECVRVCVEGVRADYANGGHALSTEKYLAHELACAWREIDRWEAFDRGEGRG